jgi:HEAT repeat protein
MIRATFIAAALGICALSSQAQNPTPPATPTPPSTAKKPATAQPTPAPKARRAHVVAPEWPSVDIIDLNDQLDLLNNMKIDMERLPPNIDMEFQLAPGAMPYVIGVPEMPVMPELPGMAVMPEMHLMPDMPVIAEMDMLDVPDMPDFPDMPDMPDMPDIPDIPDMPDMPDFSDFSVIAPMTPMAPMAPMTPMPTIAPMTPMPYSISLAPKAARDALGRAAPAIEWVQGQSPFERQFSGIASDPPKPWAQSDPADSLYRLAREALNRGEYRRAATLFGDITQKFPNSVYAADARYWRAFALYRIGGTADLRDALNALQDSGRAYRQASLQTDAPVLATRIRGALAAQGDQDSRRLVSAAASQPSGACDREDLAVRVEALKSLGQTDPESTTPIFARLLARRDDCSASLRRAALYMLGRRTDAQAMNLVISAARNDPDLRVRGEALRFLAAMPGDQAIATIEEMARTPGNEELQRAAIAALGRSDSPRAKQSLRSIVERSDLSEDLRISALSSIDAEHSPDNGAYIRAAYARLETPRLKGAAIRAVSRAGGSDNDQWLLTIVRNQNEAPEVRALALRYAGRSTIAIADLAKMYDVAGDRPLRQMLISLYAQRPEPEATDKLLDIARTGTDPDLRRYAISALSRKNDPRTKKLLVEIIDK